MKTPPVTPALVSVPVEPLWMVHVIGPDDIHPAPDHPTAVAWCASLNRLAPADAEVLLVAIPAIWTGTAEAHAGGLPDAIMAWGRIAAAPAVEGGVAKACAAFQEAIDYFEADVADVLAEGSERADLWDREVTVNIDALKIVMSAALTTRKEAPAEAEEDAAAKLLWNRFAVAHHESWADEPNKAEYRRAAADVLALLAQPQAPAPSEAVGEAMSEREVLQWIDACNHEPARQVLRDYLALATPAKVEAVPSRTAQENLIDIVEGIGGIQHGTWRDEKGMRLKDTSAWAQFYVAARTTPPAPEADKLRAALEALEKIKTHRIGSNPATVWTGSNLCRSIASEALAALNAEVAK